MKRLGIMISDDTILRHLKRRAAHNTNKRLRVVGIDDWSWRKAWSYGTIVVDLERREVVDVLPDRSMIGTANWLRQHPEVEIVNRDRCGLYAQGTREGAPQARQVADRFHLLQNLRLTIETELSRADRSTGRALLPNAESDNEIGATISSTQRTAAAQRQIARQTHRHSRQAVFDTIRTLRDTGMSIDNIARQTGFGRRSIAKWLKFDAPPDRRPAALRPSSPRYFQEYLLPRWSAGVVRGRDLFDEIKRRGSTGSFSNLERLLTTWRRANDTSKDIARLAPSITVPSAAPTRMRILDPATGHVISPIVAAALCVKPRGLLTEEQAAKVDTLKKASRDFAVMRTLAMRFQGILRSKDVSKLDDWLDEAYETGIYSIQRFVRTLNRDLDAVRNAIEQPRSNGQTEGQVNRLKTLKRAMYGRASAELLRAGMLPFHPPNHHTL